MGLADLDPNEANPYQTPRQISALAVGDWENYVDGVLRFDVAINRRDVRRLLPRSTWWIYIFVALLVLSVSSGPPYTLSIFVAFVLVVTLSIRYVQMFVLLRQVPQLTERYSGWLESAGLSTTSDRTDFFGNWSDFYDVVVTKKCLVVRFDRWFVANLIIPWESFLEPDEAKTILESICEQRKQLTPAEIGDAKMAMQFTTPLRWEPPTEHVAFDGGITFREIVATKPGKKIKRFLKAYLFLGACGFLLAILGPAFLGFTGILWAFPFVFVCFIMAFGAMAHPLMKKNNDQVAFRLRGSVSPERLMVGAATRESNSQWGEYADCIYDEDHLCIRLRGLFGGWCFLARHQFASKEDYQQACQWFESGLNQEAKA